MKRKFLVSVLTISSCSSVKLTAREIEIQERNVVETLNTDPRGNASAYVDMNNIEAMTEVCTQIVLCKVEKCNNIEFTEFGSFYFTYDMKIEKIYMDTEDKFNSGDIIPVGSNKGIIRGDEFIKLSSKSAQAQKYGYDKREYTSDDYIIKTNFGAIPIEVGKSYIVYLTNIYLENQGIYAEFGRMFAYEYTDGILYKDMDYKRMDMTLAQLEAQIKADIDKRTGRADEIGIDACLDELGERQRKEYLENLENNNAG